MEACFRYMAIVNGCPLSVSRPYALPWLLRSVSMLKSVVLPAPDGPSTASTSPDVMRHEKP
eukprot:7167371-Prymnesium_polylepis.3